MLLVTLSLALAVCTATQEPMASNDTFQNPVFNENFPDPFIVPHEGWFYAFATHNSADGFQALRSRDLVEWERLDPVGKPEWSQDQLWAPEVYEWNDGWAFFYSALNYETNKRDLAVAFGDSLLGPFRDDTILVPGAEANPGDDQNGAIDPNLYVEDGVPYLLYIREGTPRQLRIVQLAEDLASTVGETTVLLTTDREIERGVLDAPTLIKRDGKYWLFYSSGWFQSYKRDASYRVYVAVSDELNGPYVKSEEPLLTTVPDQVYLPGHQHIFELPSGEWWIAYHAWNAENEPLYGQNEQGRTLRLDRLEWTEDGPVVTGPTLDPITRPKLR